jgi:hypothetical protein
MIADWSNGWVGKSGAKGLSGAFVARAKIAAK